MKLCASERILRPVPVGGRTRADVNEFMGLCQSRKRGDIFVFPNTNKLKE